jgi:Domain of unknown function (DUF6881)
MKYLSVDWIHSFEEEPVKIYCELNDQLWEIRKVEIFRDRTAGYANKSQHTRHTKLSIEPIPRIEEIASDPQFKSHVISKDKFEKVWKQFTPSDM